MELKLFAALTALISLALASTVVDPVIAPSSTRAEPVITPSAEVENRSERPSNEELKARNVAGVYWCNQPNFRGRCQWTQSSGGLCHSFNPSAYSSFGPDHGITCTIFETSNCDPKGGKRSGLVNPGLNQVGWTYNIQTGVEWQPKGFKCGWIAGNFPGWNSYIPYKA